MFNDHCPQTPTCQRVNVLFKLRAVELKKVDLLEKKKKAA